MAAWKEYSGPITPMKSRRSLFRYSWWDATGIAMIALMGVLEIYLAVVFDRLGWAALAVAAVGLFVVRGSAGFAVHNLQHTPFFRSNGLNRLLLIATSGAGAVMPISALARGHLYHHRNAISFNDFRLRDVYSFKQVSRLFLSVALDPFMLQLLALWFKITFGKAPPPPDLGRRDFKSHAEYNDHIFGVVLYELKADPALLRQVMLESAAAICFRVTLAIINYRFLFFFFLPLMFFSGLYGLYDDFCQHYGTRGDDPMRDSVSSYGRVFNLLWFNIGYHQEHHLRPGVHWTKLPRFRARMLPEDQRRVVPICLLTNLLIPLNPAVTTGPRAASDAGLPDDQGPASPLPSE